MAQRTVPANELAIKALRRPDGKARVVYHVDGHGNEGLKLYVESSGTKTWYFRARVRGSDPNDMPLGRWPDVTVARAHHQPRAHERAPVRPGSIYSSTYLRRTPARC